MTDKTTQSDGQFLQYEHVTSLTACEGCGCGGVRHPVREIDPLSEAIVVALVPVRYRVTDRRFPEMIGLVLCAWCAYRSEVQPEPIAAALPPEAFQWPAEGGEA